MVFLLYAYVTMHGQTHVKFTILNVASDKLKVVGLAIAEVIYIRLFASRTSCVYSHYIYCHKYYILKLVGGNSNS